jgi:hypothetical protein
MDMEIQKSQAVHELGSEIVDWTKEYGGDGRLWVITEDSHIKSLNPQVSASAR